MSDNLSKLIVIVGPTASGKTDVGIKLAKELEGAIVSADSRQLYEGMDIGTAKPKEIWQGCVHDILTPDLIDGVDHYGFNIQTPDNQITLAGWQDEAFKMIDRIINENLTPLLVGGTMLYFHVLQIGFLLFFDYFLPVLIPFPFYKHFVRF